MNKRTHYRTGTRAEVMRNMASYAIRDQEALIHAYTPAFGEPQADAKLVIQQCRDVIADFRRLAQSFHQAK
jgi:acyl-CoA reductase-like NAD-dependent aldehyde dehydrogenase